jgi:hypothetical protein
MQLALFDEGVPVIVIIAGMALISPHLRIYDSFCEKWSTHLA